MTKIQLQQKNNKNVQDLIEDFSIWLKLTDYTYNLFQEKWVNRMEKLPLGEQTPLKFQDIYDEWRFSQLNEKFVNK